MAESFAFELVSPEKLLLSGDADIVTVPGVDGDMGIMHNHAPVMTSLRPGLMTVKLSDGEETTFFVRGGFADITPASVTVLAEFALAKKDMTREILDEQKRIAEEDYKRHHESGNEEKAANAQGYIEQLANLEPVLLPA